jgi:hypothetical protein
MGLVVFWIEPLGVLGVIEKLTPNVTYRVRTHLPVVALSFDDGPHPRFTLQVLEILRQHDATATFFLCLANCYFPSHRACNNVSCLVLLNLLPLNFELDVADS